MYADADASKESVLNLGVQCIAAATGDDHHSKAVLPFKEIRCFSLLTKAGMEFGHILLTMLPKEWLLLLVARLVTKTKQKCSCM